MDNALLIIGLGNPGPSYAQTRHNMGFMVVDALAIEAGCHSWQEKFSGLHCRITIGGRSCILLKPQIFMNLSGRSALRAAQFFRVEVPRIIVVHDELDLSFGMVRVKQGGGTAGHKGLESLKAELGDTGFVRVRMGIGRPVHGDVSDYVLQRFSAFEAASVPDHVSVGVQALGSVIRDGTTAAMNAFNKRDIKVS